MAALEAHCREHLSKHKRPRHLEIVKELPKNFLGKVLRRKLREAELSAKETRRQGDKEKA
jgi:long-chain acyl-CoA synthetase